MKRLLLLLYFISSSLSVQAQQIPEYELKAQYIINFGLLTEFPSLNSDFFNICILGRDNFGNYFQQKSENRLIAGKKINIARLSSLSSIRKCQILFIAERETANMKQIINELGDTPVLTVTDVFSEPGAMIVLSIEGQRLVFDIDQTKAKNAQLQFSSKLLHLVRRYNKP